MTNAEMAQHYRAEANLFRKKASVQRGIAAERKRSGKFLEAVKAKNEEHRLKLRAEESMGLYRRYGKMA